jgi:putative transposase
MMEKFKGKYRIESNRLKGWDYSSNAMYFITICTHDRFHFFGEIENHKMVLSEMGEMAQKYWLEIPDHFPFVKLDAFVVMPNHVHGIIEIAKNNDGRNVETQYFASLRPTIEPPLPSKNKFGPQSKNLASIIRGYKSAVTTYARKMNIDFAWQSNYHDHIIRDDKSYHNIANYIINNPKHWKEETFNPVQAQDSASQKGRT